MSGERYKRIVKGFLSAFFSKGTNLVVSALSVPLALRYLGSEAYGLWITISGSINMFVLLDIGIANTLTNLISEAYAEDDKDRARAYFSSAFWSICIIASVIGVIALAVWPHVNWSSLFHVETPSLKGETSKAVGIAFLVLLLSLPAGLSARVLAGYQEVHVANIFASLGSILSLAGICLAVWKHFSLSMLLAAYAFPIVASSLCCLAWVLISHKPWLRPGLDCVRFEDVTRIFQTGGQFFAIQLAGLIVFNSDNLIISHYLNPSAVTPYNVTYRLVNYVMGIQMLMMPSLWPAYSEAYAKGEIGWLRSAYNRARLVTISILIVGGAVLLLFGKKIIHWWAGASAVPDNPLLWMMCLWMAICAITVNQSTLMGAVSRVKRQAIFGGIAALCNLAFSIYWVRRFGPLGVISATVLSYVLFVLLVQTLEVRRILRGDFLHNRRDETQ